MPYAGSFETNEIEGITYYFCDHCGAEFTSEDEADNCCRYFCESCESEHRYEEDAEECCAFYCDNCGQRYSTEEGALDCCYDPEAEDDYRQEPAMYPSEILDTVVSYPIIIPEIPGRPARLCSLEQELSSGGNRAAKLLHDIGIATHPHIESYNHSGHPGMAIVKSDSSLPHGGAEVVYSRFNLSDRTMARNFSEAIWRLREMKKQLLVTTNRQAGLHIHISATSASALQEWVFGPRQMAALYEIWSFCEDVIFRLGAAGWASHRGGSYADPLPKFRNADVTPGRIVQSVGGNRYFSLNFMRLLQAAQQCRCGACAVGDWQECNCGSLMNGTIEWRVFNASTKPETIHGWLILAHALTAKAFDYELGSLSEPNGFGETPEERHQWIFSWILNECPLADVERLVLFGLAKRSPGLVIDWEDFERTNAGWLSTTTDDLDDEFVHDPQPLNIPQHIATQTSFDPGWAATMTATSSSTEPF